MALSPVVSVYLGLGKKGRMRSDALKREARRRDISVSDVFWDALRKTATGDLAIDLKEIDDLQEAKNESRT